jgi:predicted phosphoribosyltransferase
MFADRKDAGRRLGEELKKRGVEADIVLAVPRGGLPVGREVADALGLPLDIVAAKKMGAPHNEELAVGAASADGSVWLNRILIDQLGVTDEYLQEERERAAETARKKEERYRGGRIGEAIQGRRVIVVDDGVATGATTTACLRRVRAEDAEYVVLAVPVGAPESVVRLKKEANEIVCLETPEMFGAVGQFYERFGQVSDEEAIEYLERD